MIARQTEKQETKTILAAALGVVLLLAGCVDPQTTDQDNPSAVNVETNNNDADDDMVTDPDEEAPEPDPITVEMLTPRAAFTDDVAAQISITFDGRDTTTLDLPDASYIAVVKVTLQPGATFPWHTHPGPVILNFVEGRFTYILADDCVYREYQAGEALVDSGGDNVHTALNPSDTEVTVVIGTFLGVPGASDAPLTVPVDAEEQEALNEQCGL